MSSTTSQNMKANSNTHRDQLLFSRRDAAQVLGGIHPRTVDRLAADGQLHPVTVGKRRVMFHREDLAEFARSGTR
jgi:excisionase family DNA binding protein